MFLEKKLLVIMLKKQFFFNYEKQTYALKQQVQ